MSRGGRGGGRAGASSSIRAVANALGIARHDIGAFTQVIVESQPTYPPVSQTVLPLEKSDDLQYMVDLRQELLKRFHLSSFYLETKERNCDFQRYTDKYRKTEKEELRPNWLLLPEELCWKRKKVGQPVVKKRKITVRDKDEVAEKLSKLEEDENMGSTEVEQLEVGDENDEESEKEEQNNENEEQEALSDDDYQEEDNDYIHSYFDNGENYGDVGSDDNLDDDNAF